MIVEGDLSSTDSISGEPCRKRTYQSDASVSCFASITRTGYSVQNKKRVSRGCSLSANTKFKGVVLQQNGHWGAQIYANHNRVWLGTFITEVEASMAYDSAAIKLRNGECQRNFAWTKVTDQESFFQSLYSQEAVLNMIKDGSYQSNFFEFLMSRQAAADGVSSERGGSNNLGRIEQKKMNLLQKQLFQKELTPSDVGKLNRLVIPKNYATKYFPRIAAAMLGGLEGNLAPDVQLVFYDENMRPWKFRYCYWKSSQSYVFTRGWNRFVKERLLKANDTIRFYECHNDGNDELFFRISVDSAGSSRGIVENNGDQCVSQSPIITMYDKQQLKVENDDIQPQIPEVIDEVAQVVAGCKRIRLFGVCIDVDEN